MEAEKFDVVVIGTGWHGLCAAKTYTQIQPDVNLVVFENNTTIGGTWAEERLYPTLGTNNLLGTFQYPDFPMDTGKFADVEKGKTVPGKAVLEYLTQYAHHFDIYRRIRFGTRVVEAEFIGGSGSDGGGLVDEKGLGKLQWKLTIDANGEKRTVCTEKLICATGLTSEAFVPKFDGQETFDKPLFHHRDLKIQSSPVIETAKNVTVYGGTKSAWDAVYLFAAKGVQVDWVIRDSGSGPIWMSPSHVTPLKLWVEKLVLTRFLTWFSPCWWGAQDGYPRIRRFLHGTAIGRFLVNGFWGMLQGDVEGLNKYDSHPETKKLKPWIGAFWVGQTLSILNYPTDFFDLVRSGLIKVHLKDITSLSPGTVHLNDSTAFATDALICCTGWRYRPPIRFLPEGIDKELHIPHDVNHVKKDVIDDRTLHHKADEAVFQQFPALRNQPIRKSPVSYQQVPPNYNGVRDLDRPFELYRYVLPPTSARFNHSIAFLGMFASTTTAINAHVGALWTVAHLSGIVPLAPGKTEEELIWEATCWSRFAKWRTPGGRGHRHPDFVFEALSYYHVLLRDLGLSYRRKGNFLAEVFVPYGVEDYEGVIGEFVRKYGRK